MTNIAKLTFSIVSYVMFITVTLMTLLGYRGILVRGHSMNPTYADGQVCLAHLISDLPERGDVITFHPPLEDEDVLFMKRVIGLPNDEIKSINDYLYVNGKFVDHISGTGSFELCVPDGEIFVLGDNRMWSNDSRHFLTVPMDDVYAKIIYSFQKNDIFDSICVE